MRFLKKEHKWLAVFWGYGIAFIFLLMIRALAETVTDEPALRVEYIIYMVAYTVMAHFVSFVVLCRLRNRLYTQTMRTFWQFLTIMILLAWIQNIILIVRGAFNYLALTYAITATAMYFARTLWELHWQMEVVKAAEKDRLGLDPRTPRGYYSAMQKRFIYDDEIEPESDIDIQEDT